MSFPYPNNGYSSYYPSAATSGYNWPGQSGYGHSTASYGGGYQYGLPQMNYGYSGTDAYSYSQPYYGGSSYSDPYTSYGYGQGNYGYEDPYSSSSYTYMDPVSTTYAYGPPVIVDNTKYYYEPAPPSNYWTQLTDLVSGSYNTRKFFNFEVNYIKDNVFDFNTPPTDPPPTDPGNNPTKRPNNNPTKIKSKPKAKSNPPAAPPPPVDPGFQEGRFYNKQRVPGRFMGL